MAFPVRRPALFLIFVVCLSATLLVAFLLALLPIGSPKEICNCPTSAFEKNLLLSAAGEISDDSGGIVFNLDSRRLAVIVPFRDRFDELLKFIPHMNQFLNEQHVPHKFYIVNQIDKYRFNRASLINVGFLLSCNETDYIAMHDVDLLPLNPQLRYDYPSAGPHHVASPDFHPRYHYKTFVGGILLITIHHFRKANGMSNKYWGWGMEDDEFYARIKRIGLNVTRPTNIDTGVDNTFRHIHDRFRRKRDTAKLFNQREVNRKLDMTSGLSSIEYSVAKVHDLTIQEIPFKVIDVELRCNVTATPWCEFASENGQKLVKPVAKKQEP